MLVRVRTNGSIIDVPDGPAQRLIEAGIYEVVDAEVVEDAGDAPPPPKKRRRRRR